jgi:hypothetical protein
MVKRVQVQCTVVSLDLRKLVGSRSCLANGQGSDEMAHKLLQIIVEDHRLGD